MGDLLSFGLRRTPDHRDGEGKRVFNTDTLRVGSPRAWFLAAGHLQDRLDMDLSRKSIRRCHG